MFAADRVLVEAVDRSGAAGWAPAELHELGRLAGSELAQRWGEQANANPPQLKAFDRYGHRVDQVEYHPAYHELMRSAIAAGLHAWPWADDRAGAHSARAAKMLVWYRVDAGHTCPISMTYSVVPALRHQPEVAAAWTPGLVSREYDPRFAPPAGKAGLTMGMGMTEKQGGSDVRANTTLATPTGDADGAYVLTGHKWFCSAPMSDAFLMLAQTPTGTDGELRLSCFLVPRWRPDGTPNVFRIQRLKDKLGDRSNASSEIELEHTWAQLVGEEGRGVPTIIEMVNHTRLDCSLGSASIMRQGVAQALWHTEHRSAFGDRLVDKPLMQNVLVDLAVESEAATITAMWLADLFDRGDDERAALLRRLALPVVKYWLCKRAPVHTAETLECFGGAGYVEESGMPRLFRQSPLNGIWEGSGNVICLDVLRAMARSPESVEAFFDEVERGTQLEVRLDTHVEAIRKELADFEAIEWRARHLVERMALVLQASLLVQFGDARVADVFVASRLEGRSDRAFGTMAAGGAGAASVRSILDRHHPGAGV